MKKYKLEKVVLLILFIIIIFISVNIEPEQENIITNNQISYEIIDIPEYNGEMYVVIENNEPKFSEEDMQIDEYYTDLEDGRVRNGYDKNLLEESK